MTSTTSTQARKSLGGYSLTKVKEGGYDCSLGFEATITLDGTPIATVSNDGNGGCHLYRPFIAPAVSSRLGTDNVTDADRAAVTAAWAAIKTLDEFATEWNKDNDLAGFEDTDALVYHLLEVTKFNRARTVAFQIEEDGDFWTTGQYRKFPAKVTHDQALTLLRSPRYAAKNPRIWDKTVGDFVPVA